MFFSVIRSLNFALVDIYIYSMAWTTSNLMTRVYNVGIKNIAIELGQTMNKGPRGQQKNIPKKNGQWISSQTQHWEAGEIKKKSL